MHSLVADYAVPPDVHPLMGGVLTAMHDRHIDMLALIDGLPPGALLWRPGPQMSGLAGLARHVMDVWASTVRVAAGDLASWHGENGALLDATDAAPALVACIATADAYCKRVLPALTAARLADHWPGNPQRTIGMTLVEEGDHAAMHHGQMQVTRHLYEHAHARFRSGYTHWR